MADFLQHRHDGRVSAQSRRPVAPCSPLHERVLLFIGPCVKPKTPVQRAGPSVPAGMGGVCAGVSDRKEDIMEIFRRVLEMNERPGRGARWWLKPCPNRADCGASASKAHSAADSCSDKYSRAPLTLEPRSGTLKVLNGQVSIFKTTLRFVIDCVVLEEPIATDRFKTQLLIFCFLP